MLLCLSKLVLNELKRGTFITCSGELLCTFITLTEQLLFIIFTREILEKIPTCDWLSFFSHNLDIIRQF